MRSKKLLSIGLAWDLSYGLAAKYNSGVENGVLLNILAWDKDDISNATDMSIKSFGQSIVKSIAADPNAENLSVVTLYSTTLKGLVKIANLLTEGLSELIAVDNEYNEGDNLLPISQFQTNQAVFVFQEQDAAGTQYSWEQLFEIPDYTLDNQVELNDNQNVKIKDRVTVLDLFSLGAPSNSINCEVYQDKDSGVIVNIITFADETVLDNLKLIAPTSEARVIEVDEENETRLIRLQGNRFNIRLHEIQDGVLPLNTVITEGNSIRTLDEMPNPYFKFEVIAQNQKTTPLPDALRNYVLFTQIEE